MSVQIQIYLFIALITALAIFCLQFGIPGLYKKSITLLPSKNISGNPAVAIASVFTFVGVITGSYVFFGVYSLLRIAFWAK